MSSVRSEIPWVIAATAVFLAEEFARREVGNAAAIAVVATAAFLVVVALVVRDLRR